MRKWTVIFLLFLLYPAFEAGAQWSGSVSLLGGYGQDPGIAKDTRLHHGLGQGSVQLEYKKTGFRWNTTLGSSYQTLATEILRLTASEAPDDPQGYRLDVDLKHKKDTPWSLDLRTEATWTPSKKVVRRAWAQYGYRGETGSNLTGKLVGVDTHESSGLYYDYPISRQHRVEAGYEMVRHLGSPHRIFGANVTLSQQFKNQNTEWIVLEESADAQESIRVYRITPQSAQTGLRSAIHWRDSVLTSGPVRLVVDHGIRLGGGFTDDRNSGATLESLDSDVWRDSTRLRENFKFLTLTAEPYATANLKWGDITAHAGYGVEIYARYLSSDVHSNGAMQFERLSLIGNAGAVWKISEKHTLTLGTSSAVKHPDYLQVCWYDRQGAYVGQVYRGSTSLTPTRTHTFNLGYAFKYKGFQAALTATVTRRLGDIEQTYFTEVTEEGKEQQVFTWLNASDSWALGLSPKLGWSGRYVKVSAGTTYNRSALTSRTSGEVKRNSDWSLWGNVSVMPGKGWSLDADVRYRSSVSTFFSSFGEYWTLNVKVQKAFKRLVVYLEGRDLLDKPVDREYRSADETQTWTERSHLNRNVFLLGVSWKF